LHFYQMFKCFAGIGVVSGWGMITGEHTSFVFVFAFHLKMGWTHSFLDGVYLHSILGMFESQLQKKFWQIGMPLSIIINHKIFNTSSYLYIIKLQEKKLYKGKWSTRKCWPISDILDDCTEIRNSVWQQLTAQTSP
jgi:hypothetical protein